MTVFEDMATFLRKRRQKASCVDCIAVALVKNRHQLQPFTAALAHTADFDRGSGGYVDCHSQKKMATRAN